MKKNVFLFITFLLASIAHSQTIDKTFNEYFLKDNFVLKIYDAYNIRIGIHYIDQEKVFFDKLLIIYASKNESKIVFKIDKDQIYDFWSNVAEEAPIPKGLLFYGYKINIKDNMDFSLDVFSNGGRNFINSARVYFWKTSKKSYEPLY
jgi:hypothetical protein